MEVLMRKILPEPTLLRQLLDYDQKSGILTWKNRPKMHQNGMTSGHLASINGKIAGSALRSGHIILSFNGGKYLAHRIAWAISHDVQDFDEIDHINGDPSDNRLENLRCVQHSENQKNLKRRSDNTSGVVGVGLHSQTGSWRAYINFAGKRHHIGLFATKDEAINARLAVQKDVGFHINHGR
jgi:hypothetical protein